MTVYLVGAGPGHPELITVRGARLLASAEIVVHDRLAAPLLEHCSSGTELVDVGKQPGSAPVPQSEINTLLVELGRRRERVVRLKGGDPFVFARGGEEVAALRAAGVPCEVVPGVSSALAAPAAAGVPLTVRRVASSFVVLTGHEGSAEIPEERWQALAHLGGTIVVLMGARRISRIAGRLLAAGLSAETPVVAVRSATTEQQEIRRTTLGALDSHAIGAPVVFVIGEVAGLHPVGPTP
ncbi:MAG: uroporphyrinogen-III C-methyltransferase [Acidimicrobiales bacterium]